MAETITIAAERRERAGKGAARAVRRASRIPGVIYGDGKPAVMVHVDRLTMNKLLKDPAFTTHPLQIEYDGNGELTLARDIQYDPVTDEPLHFDFLRVSESTTISVEVPVQFINDDRSPGLKIGGVLNVVRYEIELVCRADRIPDHITVDLTGRELGDSIHISDVSLPEGVRPAITDRDFTVATVVAPSGLKSEPGAGEAA